MTSILTAYRTLGNLACVRLFNVIIIAYAWIFVFHMNCSLADTIILNAGAGTEEYSGRILSGNQDRIKFDVECTGELREFRWGNPLVAVQMNKRCTPPTPIGAGGFDLDCDKSYMLLDSKYEQEVFIDAFSIVGGAIKFGQAFIDVESGVFADESGKVVARVRGGTLTVTVTRIRNNPNFCG